MNIKYGENALADVNFLVSLLDVLTGAVLVLDDAGSIRFASPAIERLMGYTPAELLGKSAHTFLFSPDPERAELTYQRVQKERPSLSAVLQLRHKSGFPVTVSLSFKNEQQHPDIGGIVVSLHPEILHQAQQAPTSLEEERIRFDEQKRLAQELHDGVNQTLTATKLLLETSLSAGEGWQPLVKRSVVNIQESIASIRNLSHQRLAEPNDLPSLNAALEELATLYQTLSLHVSLRIPKEADAVLSSVQKHHLLRIVQEALTNTSKHAGATRLHIHGAIRHGQFWLLVKDNGHGFEAGKPSSGVGINNIRHRVLTLSGSFQFGSKPGWGTILQIRIPLNVP